MSARHDIRVRTGTFLRDARVEVGHSQQWLAKRIGITQASLSNYERGVRDVPLWVLISAAGHLGFDVSIATSEIASEVA